jgi:hypothetical protein
VTGPEEPSVAEALGHLQAAVLELIAAARVSLDAVERAVRAIPPPPARAETEPGEGTGRTPPGVEHIRVS